MSDSVRPQRRQPTRLPHPWDSPGKNTGVGCHFPLQCMKVKSKSEVAQSCPTLQDPMDCSLPGSSVHGIFQARVLEWGAIAFSVPMNIQGQFPLGLPGLISLQSKGSKALTLWCLAFFMVQLSHPYMTTGNTIALTRWTFVSNVMSLRG